MRPARLAAGLVVIALGLLGWASACVDVHPDINEACDDAADRCPDDLAYDACVRDAIAILKSDPEQSSVVYKCLSEQTACANVGACFAAKP